MPSASDAEIFWPNVKNSWEVFIAVGQPPAKISVRNLQAIIRIGKDAWGREGKVQPVLISATVSLRKPFATASVQDAVTKSTVHYGTLSKAILEATQDFPNQGGQSETHGKMASVKDLMRCIEDRLAPKKQLVGREGKSEGLLDRDLVSSLELEITLPKALLSSTTGVSRISTILFDELGERRGYEQEYWGMSLVLRNLQLSTLIGVNSNERLAKQIVIVNIELDVWTTERDVYNELEDVAVKTVEESSFQTLESLASHLAWRITRYAIHPHLSKYYKTSDENEAPLCNPSIKINLSKPTAVTLADAPIVEITVGLTDMLNRTSPCSTPLPFPLQGRLDEWIKEHDPEGLKRDPVPVLGG